MLHLTSKGWKAKSIAKALGLSVATVYNYRNTKPKTLDVAPSQSEAPLPPTGDSQTVSFSIDKVAPDGRIVVTVLCPVSAVNDLLDHLVSRYTHVKK